MDREETAKILSMLRASYPKFYSGMSRQELENIVNLWNQMFDEPYNVVMAAVQALISSDTKGFPPVIGQVKEKIRLLTHKEPMTEGEAWGYVSHALMNSAYGAKEEFAKLPPEIQKVVGSPTQLKEWASMDVDEVQSVVASNFQRSFRTVAKREKELAALPGSVRKFMTELADRTFGSLGAPELNLIEPTDDEIRRADAMKKLKMARLAEWQAKGLTEGGGNAKADPGGSSGTRDQS